MDWPLIPFLISNHMNTTRLLLAALAAALVGCQTADTTAPAPKAAAKAAPKPAPAQYVFYVGTSGAKAPGILRCVLDGKTGKISVPTVAAYAVEGDKLRLLNTEASKGKGPTHLVVDAAGRNLVVVNYGSGSTTALPIKADGSFAPASSSIQHVGSGPNAGRQSGPHAHGVYFHPKNGRAYVADLGTDDIFIFRFDADKGLLTPNKPKSGRVTAGEGPRHLAFHPSGKFAYVNTEMGLNVVAFSVAGNGGLNQIQSLPTLPEGADKKGVSTAEIFVRPNGKTLYVSNRGHDSIAVYAIAQDGKLTLLQHMLGTPATPRGFGLSADGRWLVCAGQKSGTLNAYRIGQDGKLTDTKQSVEAAAAAAVVFVP